MCHCKMSQTSVRFWSKHAALDCIIFYCIITCVFKFTFIYIRETWVVSNDIHWKKYKNVQDLFHFTVALFPKHSYLQCMFTNYENIKLKFRIFVFQLICLDYITLECLAIFHVFFKDGLHIVWTTGISVVHWT